MQRNFIAASAAALALGAAALCPAAASAQANVGPIASLDFLGKAEFSTASLAQSANFVGGTRVGGLSGLAYAGGNQFLALSDDPSSNAAARFYGLTIDLSGGTLDNGRVSFTGVTTLRDGSGNTFALNSLDPEGFALTPDGQSVWVASEGFKASGVQPFIRRFDRITGQQVAPQAGQPAAELSVPTPRYQITDPANTSSGPRNNLAFESLAFTPSGARLYTANEGALYQDGPAAAFGVQSNVRLAAYDPATGARTAEYLYRTGPVVVQPNPSGTFSVNGLVDILFTGEDTFLALERSFTANADNPNNNQVRLYQVRIGGAQDISGIDALTDGVVGGLVGVEKTLLFDFDTLGVRIDNLEGLAFGPTLADGSLSLIAVADDNFANPPAGVEAGTQFFAFRVNAGAAVPEPGALGLAAAGLLPLAGIVLARRRRK